MKQFTVPCQFGPDPAARTPFPIYVGEPNPENHPLKYQSEWLLRERAAQPPQSVLDSLGRLQNIATRGHVSFEDLCAYAIGQARQEQARPPATLEEAQHPGQPSAHEPISLQVIHNPEWEKRVREQDDERAKLPQLTLITPEPSLEGLDRPARLPKPGVELQAERRRVPTDAAELASAPFRHFYDWLRTRPNFGHNDIQAIVAMMVPAEAEEEQLFLSTLMLEEVQSVLLPHSFAETLDFLFHYEDVQYTLAVLLDTGAQFLNRATFGNLLYFHRHASADLEALRQRLNAMLHAFAHLPELSPARLELAPEGFDAVHFHQRCGQWFTLNPQAA